MLSVKRIITTCVDFSTKTTCVLLFCGQEIYNSRKEREPVSFVIGSDKVLQGWNEGVIGMKAGGTSLLRIPPELGYVEKAVEDVVPSDSYLQFIIELFEVK